jgi:hypothetical protein
VDGSNVSSADIEQWAFATNVIAICLYFTGASGQKRHQTTGESDNLTEKHITRDINLHAKSNTTVDPMAMSTQSVWK